MGNIEDIDIGGCNTFSGITNEDKSWEFITKKALGDKNLNADIRVDKSGRVTIVRDRYALWRAIKPWFGYSATPNKAETSNNLKDKLQSYAFRQGIKKDSTKFQRILSDLETNITDKSKKCSISKAIQQAHNETRQLIDEINSKKEGVDHTPQVIFFYKTEEMSEIPSVTIIEPAPEYEEISYSGGGNKGSAYGGTYKVLEEYGKLKKLQRVSGSSVGTIPAAFTAVGMDASRFDQASEEVEALDFMKESTNIDFKSELQKHITFDKSKLGYNGTLALEKINKQLIDTVYSYLTSVKEQKEWSHLSESERLVMTEFKQLLVNGYMPLITFRHLASLHKMNPEKFKDLSICVYDATHSEPVMLSSDSTDEEKLDLPIVAAIRMSAAFPIAFKPVLWRGNLYKDGGVIFNNPSSVSQRGRYQQQVGDNVPLTPAALAKKESSATSNHPRILYLTFNYGGETYDVLHQGKIEVSRSLGMSFKERVTRNFRFRRDQTEENADLWSRAANVKVVPHGDIETLDFYASKKRREAVKLQAEIWMREQLAHHQHEAIYKTYSLTELLNVFGNHPEKITDAALEAIIKKSTEERQKFERFKSFEPNDPKLIRVKERSLQEITSLLEAATKEKEKRSALNRNWSGVKEIS